MFKRIRFIAKIEYGLFLPYCARLHWKIGMMVAKVRGRINAWANRDFWRIDVLGDKELPKRIDKGIQIVLESVKKESPKKREIEALRKRIFETVAMEELESAWLGQRKRPNCKVEFENVDRVLEYKRSGKNIVFLTAHYGNSIMGISFLGDLGFSPLVMSSDFYLKKDGVPESMKRFYSAKYEGLSSFLNKGKVLAQEGNLKKFYDWLGGGGDVLILGDLPAFDEKNILWVDFFDQKRAFSQGASRMARAKGAAIVPFVCVFENGRYVVKFGDLSELVDDESEYNSGYKFLEEQIKKSPEYYYGMDLLPLFAIKEENR